MLFLNRGNDATIPEAEIMKRQYEWKTNDAGERELVVTDHQEKLTLTFPRGTVEPRVCRGFSHGAADVVEAFIAKVAADASGSMKAVEKRLLGGPDPSETERKLQALLDGLKAAGIDPSDLLK